MKVYVVITDEGNILNISTKEEKALLYIKHNCYTTGHNCNTNGHIEEHAVND